MGNSETDLASRVGCRVHPNSPFEGRQGRRACRNVAHARFTPVSQVDYFEIEIDHFEIAT